MNLIEKRDSVGFLSLAAVSTLLLAGWIADSARMSKSHEQRLARDAITVTADGRTKLTVTARAPEAPVSRQGGTVASRQASVQHPIATLGPLFLR